MTSPSFGRQVAVGVTVALVVAAILGIWRVGLDADWSALSGGDTDTVAPTREPSGPTAVPADTPAPTSPPPTADPGSDSTSAPEEAQPAGSCSLSISNPFATINETPEPFGLEVGSVPAGTYVVREITVEPFGSVDQRWFRIDVNGQTGWIQDSSILLDAKTGDCS